MDATAEANVQTVMSLYAAFEKGDVEGMLVALDPAIDWEFYGPNTIPLAGRYHGHDEVLRFIGMIGDSLDIQNFSPDVAVVASGDGVAVTGKESGLARPTGRPFESHFVHMFTLRGGKIVAAREYYDTAALVTAFTGAGD
ncbi:MAG: nuclear transport factor 2 family protein [Dehalococcoidia bacterium]